MKRRSFNKSLLALTAGSPLAVFAPDPKKTGPVCHHSTEMDTVVFVPGISKPIKILQVSDSHISVENEKERDFDVYGTRMHNAFRTVKHHKTGADGTTLAHFKEILAIGRQEGADLLALSGDIVNYPSAVAIELVRSEVAATGLPYMYTAGNHDWHYEGMEGTADQLRDYWCRERLQPLYQGGIYYSSRMVGDINVVMIDNSTYQVSEAQLAFFREELKKGAPVALIVHIPLYMPGMGMCCGHPEWGEASDKNFTIERRQRWPAEGNRKPTVEFVKEAVSSGNVAGIFAGHWHQYRSLSWNGATQHLALPAFRGQYRMIRFMPA